MRTRIVFKHDPLFAVGLIAHRRNRHPLRAFARAVVFRILAARARKERRVGGGLPAHVSILIPSPR